jgi:2-keto-4-pentenoate hydratase/2-oxohepta-3-ene-1,7-dioic acid hydratase in catechol pathway
MKLLRFGPVGSELPGMLGPGGEILDLSDVVADISGDVLSPNGLARLAALDPDDLPRVDGTPRLGAPVSGSTNFVGIGLNFADHAAETGAALPAEPIVFFKSTGIISGPNDDIIIPQGSTKTDWEVELAVVIGTTAKSVSEADALGHVAGYCICNDVSEREWQLERGGSWDKGKSFDSFGPLGPWLVTRDEIGDPQALDMFLDIDGQRKQTGSTRTMIFSVQKIVSYVSHFLTLHPGDVITTGTPPGVGLGQKPPQFLRAGQTVQLGIEGLGVQRQSTRHAMV